MKEKKLTFWVLILTINANIDQVLENIIPTLVSLDIDQIIISHQIFDAVTKVSKKIPKNIQYIVSYEAWVSKNRNIALRNCTTDIFHICGDDILYEKNFIQNIKEAFLQTPHYGIITFQALARENKKNLIPITETREHSRISLLRTKSCVFVYNRNIISDAWTKFDENFWLWTDNPTWEEHIFWNDILSLWYKARHVDIPIVSHPIQTSWQKYENITLISARIFVFRRMFWFVWWCFALFFFSVRDYTKYCHHISVFQYIQISIRALFSKTPRN